MDAQLKAKWIGALRSGEYTQHRGGLLETTFKPKHLCCLGVLWDVCGRTNALDDLWQQHVPTQRTTLIRMNDSEGKTFPEIADYIEANL